MGRRDAVQVTLEVVAGMRRLIPNLLVTYEPGWETRGNGTTADYVGSLVHHTAGASSAARPFPSHDVLVDGRPDLDGPLCNESVPWCTLDAPRLHVVAAHPANHAGASGGRSMGPLPVTRLFNPKVRGLEIDYAGSTAMSDGQRLVAETWSAVNADVVGGGDIETSRAHTETSVTGKWDIGSGAGPSRSVDMPAWRRSAAARRTTTPTTAPRKRSHMSVLSVPPGGHVTIPRPGGGTVDLAVALDDNGLGWRPDKGRAEDYQLVRASVHEADTGRWRALYPSTAGLDGLTFWIPTGVPVSLGGMRDFVDDKKVRRYDDVAVIRNLHPALNLGVTVTHLV